MSPIKINTLSAFALLVLAGCGATKQASVKTPEVAVTAPLVIVKKAPVSENDLKRWV